MVRIPLETKGTKNDSSTQVERGRKRKRIRSIRLFFSVESTIRETLGTSNSHIRSSTKIF